MISALLSRLIILSFGTLYPAYASYKAVRTKNVKEYVKWMMYWIVYAFFTCIETFTDIFLSWFPFYYEVKVIIVLWLLSPATKGSSTLYRKFVHPMLTRREQEIDEYLNQAKERGYSAVLQLGTKGVNYATNVIMQTALKGGGNLVQTIRRSYSLSDLSEPDVHRTQDEIDDVVQMRPQQRMLRPRTQAGIARSASGTRHSTGMYFSEVDVAKGADGFNYNIRSSEDISSGYSSAEPVSAALSRTSSMTNATKTRLKARRTENLNEPKQYRQLEQNIFAQSTLLAPGGGFGSLENEVLLESSENLQNPTLFDVQQCIHILEDTSQVAFQDKVDEAFAETKRPNEKMLPIEENNDMESSRILKNVDNLKDFGGGIQSAEQPPYSDHLEQQQDKEEEATFSTNEPAAAIHEQY
ncbi:receptor expression-enhancing protein 3-B isoform X2 [Rhagoletis pomonella]|uniref:receptor expression-enhancing protein 3-B isoform X2 n=1 Tax=Rhagoletis pomonella TaxID=28610 RepID=UPI00177D47FE|nr:receptor expression-enhancing protein 3-B isoform X2 [Rhagoletis pomonella]